MLLVNIRAAIIHANGSAVVSIDWGASACCGWSGSTRAVEESAAAEVVLGEWC